MRLIRVDDYPYPYDRDRRGLSEIINILEKYEMNYILGASPLTFEEGDIDFLNKNIVSGRVVMHGFNHAFDFSPWSDITKIWPQGGEFYNLSFDEIDAKYKYCHSILNHVHRYDFEHFIPPFNCYTQSLLDVLKKYNVKYLHTCDTEYYQYGFDKLNHYDINVIVSEFQKTYHDACEVIKNLHLESQITLHWICDRNLPDLEKNYVALCEAIIKNERI